MDKKVLTPGPLTTSLSTKEAMLHDWGSRDKIFIDLNHSIRLSLLNLIDGQDNYQCVPMQGSGTFAVESMISSLTSKKAKILILINGAYGHRMKKMCDYLNRSCISYEGPEDTTHDLSEIEKIINSNSDLTHVFAVYCETTSGILNPLQDIADLVEKKKLSLFILLDKTSPRNRHIKIPKLATISISHGTKLLSKIKVSNIRAPFW